MSTLRSALDELRLEDLRFVGDDTLVADLDELERAGRIVQFERARRLREVEGRGTFAVDGRLSVSSWLTDRADAHHGASSGPGRGGPSRWS